MGLGVVIVVVVVVVVVVDVFVGVGLRLFTRSVLSVDLLIGSYFTWHFDIAPLNTLHSNIVLSSNFHGFLIGVDRDATECNNNINVVIEENSTVKRDPFISANKKNQNYLIFSTRKS